MTVLILSINLFSFLAAILIKIFAYLLYLPGRRLLRFIFYKIIVRFYSWYFFIIRKLGWQQNKDGPIVFMIKQRFVHILVIGMTVFLLFINLSNKTKADDVLDTPEKTILANLIKNEFEADPADEQLIVETFDREETISAIQQSYLDNLSAFRPQQKANINGEEEDEDIKTIQNGGSIVKPDIASTKVTKRARTEIITYTINTGDTISTIAENFDINVTTILWENSLTAYSVIRPGDTLRIPPANGVSYAVAKGESLSSIAKKFSVGEDEIIKANKIEDGSKLSVGLKLFIPGGKKIQEVKTAPKANTRYTGFSAISDLIEKVPGSKSITGNKMVWPAGVRTITQYYSWRHTATDIAGPVGTPIYAADSGTIELEGWGRGYGNQIVINHGGGKKTRYAHLSKFYVEKGEKVTKGQAIAAMGSTGNSTGPHLHFEVIINSVKYNPLNYIK